MLFWVLECTKMSNCTLNMILYVSKNYLEGAGKKKDVSGMYLLRLSKVEGEWKCEYAGNTIVQFTNLSCLETGIVSKKRPKLLSNLFAWF